jgi:hypothetical protein
MYWVEKLWNFILSMVRTKVNVKVRFVKQSSMQMYGGMDIELLAFLTCFLDKGERLASYLWGKTGRYHVWGQRLASTMCGPKDWPVPCVGPKTGRYNVWTQRLAGTLSGPKDWPVPCLGPKTGRYNVWAQRLAGTMCGPKDWPVPCLGPKTGHIPVTPNSPLADCDSLPLLTTQVHMHSPSSFQPPSVWYAAVAVPKRNPEGNLKLDMMFLSCREHNWFILRVTMAKNAKFKPAPLQYFSSSAIRNETAPSW